MQKIITWTKKSSKRRQEWGKTSIESGMRDRKSKTFIKTRFAIKVILFEEALEFKQTIVLLWEAKDVDFTSKSPKGPRVGHCRSCP